MFERMRPLQNCPLRRAFFCLADCPTNEKHLIRSHREHCSLALHCCGFPKSKHGGAGSITQGAPANIRKELSNKLALTS
ncbi:hypothetical protein ABIE33_002250 [Ensifer sp. 4252]